MCLVWYSKNSLLQKYMKKLAIQQLIFIIHFFLFCFDKIYKILKGHIFKNYQYFFFEDDRLFLTTFFSFLFLFFFSYFCIIKYLLSGIWNYYTWFSYLGWLSWFMEGRGPSTYKAFINESVDATNLPPNLFFIFYTSSRASLL